MTNNKLDALDAANAIRDTAFAAHEAAYATYYAADAAARAAYNDYYLTITRGGVVDALNTITLT